MPIAERCARCVRKPPAFDAAIAAVIYRYPMDILITRAKYNGDLAVARMLGIVLSEKVAPQVFRDKNVSPIDAVIPVPLSALRQRERGYNQATEIARVVATRLKVPLRANLMRSRETEKQADLNFKARIHNVRGAFSAATLDRALAGLHILLIDDVMTTGATLNEAAKALKAAGATRVTVAVVARAVSGLHSAKMR
jgi:ComF family protein